MRGSTNARQEVVGALTVFGAAVALTFLGLAALGALFAYADSSTAAGEVRQEATVGCDLASPEAQAPANLQVLVDTRGITLPESRVSGQYAATVAADVAERAFGKEPAGRVDVSLRSTETTLDPDYYDMVNADTGLYWTAEVQTADGSVLVYVDAMTGVDLVAHASEVEQSWAWFDEWAASGVKPPDRSGTEEELRAAREEARARLEADEDLSAEVIEGRLYAATVKRDGAREFIASHEDDPEAKRAVEVALACVGEAGLGNGAEAVSGVAYATGSDNGERVLCIDVTLDDGMHLFCRMASDGDPWLVGYDRHAADAIEVTYGKRIARYEELLGR